MKERRCVSSASAESSEGSEPPSLSTTSAEEEPLGRAGRGKQSETKHRLPGVGSFQPARWAPSAARSRTGGAGRAAGHCAFPSVSSPRSRQQAAAAGAHAVGLAHGARSFCLSLCGRCDEAIGLYGACSLSLCGYSGACVKETMLTFGWQRLNCTAPLCAVGTARAQRV